MNAPDSHDANGIDVRWADEARAALWQRFIPEKVAWKIFT